MARSFEPGGARIHRASLITERFGRPLPRPAAIRIHEVSDGNPMFALELARAELDASAAPGDLPTSLAALVNHRLGHLGGETHTVLLAAACAAAPTVDVLSRATQLPPARVVGSIETAESLGVVRLDGQHVRRPTPWHDAVRWRTSERYMRTTTI